MATRHGFAGPLQWPGPGYFAPPASSRRPCLGCPGYAHVDNYSNTLSVKNEHHHENAYKRSEFALRNKLKRAAEYSSEKSREVFNDTCLGDPASTLVSYQQLKSSVQKGRKLFPLLPKNIPNFCHFY